MTTRRDFIKTVSIGTVGALTLGAAACARKEEQSGAVTWPSDKLNLAFIGIRGRGARNIGAMKEHNVVALCDVDWREQQQEMFEKYPKAKRYKDFREMFDKQQNEIDAVVISTPDHTHGVAAMMAIKAGKHVYCEKPLAHSIMETHAITEAAKEQGVQTQMGNQGHSSNSIREFYEHIKAGTIGKVTEVHAWCNRPAGGGGVSFPHGILRPTGDYKVPRELDWDLWLGPAEKRPYHPLYMPKKWRGFIDFGCGALGDFGCHTLDPAFWALDLGSPESIISSNSNLLDVDYDTFPTSSIITYKFPERGDQPPVKLIWYDGGILPLHDDRLRGLKYPSTGGLVIGEKGMIMHGSHGAGGYKVMPFDKNKVVEKPPKLLERTNGHHADWLDAIKTGKPASANFNYGGPLTETVLLGTAATLFRNQELVWDNENKKVSNFEEANTVIHPEFREGWTL